jgi:hypothetical protein
MNQATFAAVTYAVVSLILLAAILWVSLRGRGKTTVTMGGVVGLKPGDVLHAHGRQYRILKIDGHTVTWKEVHL